MSDQQASVSRTHRTWVLSAVETFEQRLVRFALRLLGDEESARDVVQHAFLQLCRQTPEKAKELGEGEVVSRWLFSVVRRRTIDLYRQNERQPTVNGELTTESVSSDNGPAYALQQKELGELMLELVDHLPHAQRESVLLWAEGWTAKEIAEITDRAPATVRVHLHKAFSTLRGHAAVRKLQEMAES